MSYNEHTEEFEEEGFDENGYTLHQFVADPGQEPLRIDKFLTNRIEGVSRNIIQSAVENGQVFVNGHTVKSNYKIRPGDKIEVKVDEKPIPLEVTPENIPIDIVYEDDQLMVVNKPPGMVVHPGHNNYSGTLLNALAYYFDVKVDFRGKRPWLVHRIDKDTSGLLVIAKTDQAMSHLAAQFKAHSTERTYYALVWGCPEEKEGTIITQIVRDQYDRKRFATAEDEEIGKRAVTHYKVLEDFMYASLIQCNLETGRTHQIRVHMKHIGHTLFNDIHYGGEKILKGVVFSKYKQFIDNCFQIMPRQALHAASLGFDHPVTGERMLFKVDFPEDFATVLEKWRKVSASNQFS